MFAGGATAAAASATSPVTSEVKFGASSPKHAYSHPKRQEADDQQFQNLQLSVSTAQCGKIRNLLSLKKYFVKLTV